RAMLGENNYAFSFSGLKTAVLNYLNRAAQKEEEVKMADLAASFQASVVEVLVEKTMLAVKNEKVATVLLAGGVSANSRLRQEMQKRCAGEGIKLFYPPLEYCTDNAAMIACAGYYRYLKGDFAGWDLNAVPQLRLL
ncbi:MAG TPA: tRNA (adenosine(37)-N6)-threonylcarbamoyltransferase complex transferase subunit TsaD, partial [Peptococcaceae bacterium]|nr:tRNA (adenosine(37)-N6)-threonylcarbamoyltransferase complex transferase subunit TsaD [Peptococcaceae bacterium]